MNKSCEMKKGIMLTVDFLILAAFLLLDQFTKYLAIVKLKGQKAIVLIDGALELQYLENRGSAFGMFQNQKLFLVVVSCLFMAILTFILLRLPTHKKYVILHIALTSIVAGGIGNLIDRLRFDYVVDFISFILINYPIFNVADIFVVVGTIGLFLLFLFYYKEEDLDFLSFKKKTQAE